MQDQNMHQYHCHSKKFMHSYIRASLLRYITQCSDSNRVLFIFIPTLYLGHCCAASVLQMTCTHRAKISGIRNLRALIESGE